MVSLDCQVEDARGVASFNDSNRLHCRDLPNVYNWSGGRFPAGYGILVGEKGDAGNLEPVSSIEGLVIQGRIVDDNDLADEVKNALRAF